MLFYCKMCRQPCPILPPSRSNPLRSYWLADIVHVSPNFRAAFRTEFILVRQVCECCPDTSNPWEHALRHKPGLSSYPYFVSLESLLTLLYIINITKWKPGIHFYKLLRFLFRNSALMPLQNRSRNKYFPFSSSYIISKKFSWFSP